jgi:translation initiation factor IF-3
VVGAEGEQLGVMPLYQAREVAKSQNLDLVEVAAVSVPPVCRLLDYGKYKFEMEKKEKEARKSQKIAQLREVRLRPKIGDQDFDVKLRLTKKLLDEGDKVKVAVLFRGREITHPDIAFRLLQRLADQLKDVAIVEERPLIDGKRMNLTLAPNAAQKAAAKKAKEEVKKD